MKKLLKAVALATVMCMLLSTAAFASEFGTATGDIATKAITANVVSAGAGNEVVLLIVEAGKAPAAADDANIMYIDQKVAGTDGVATFENILIKDDKTVVDVYVGSKATGGAQLIGAGIDLKDASIITLAKPVYTLVGEADYANGFAAVMDVELPAGVKVNKMIWGFQIEGETGIRHYSEAQNVAGLSGSVQFAAAFSLGLKTDNVKVSDVSAIFLTTDNAEYFTNAADKDNKKPVVVE